MNIVKCGIHNCNNYLFEEEVKFVLYNNKVIPICDICDDGSYEEVMVGDHRESFKKIEKIRRKRKDYDG